LSWEARTDAVKAGVLDEPVPTYEVAIYRHQRNGDFNLMGRRR
jgi:hypothetical protein